MDSRAALAAPLLLQSPPGQVPNVHDDLAGLVGSEGDSAQADEVEYKKLAAQVREQHNLEQHIVVDLPDGKGKSVLCTSAAHPSGSGRFLAPRSQITFTVDHETLSTSDIRSYKPNAYIESFRLSLEKHLLTYVEDRYSTGIVDVFAVPLPRVQVPVKEETVEAANEAEKEIEVSSEPPTTATEETDDAKQSQEGEGEPLEGEDQAEKEKGDEAMEDVKDDPVETATAMEEVEANEEEVNASVPDEDEETEGETKLVIHIVSNRYKLSNFWSGRWRSTYTLSSPTASQIDSQVDVLIHYFEEGNVQLNSSKSESLTINNETSEEARSKAIVRAIETFEANYQEELFKTCNELSEGAFKSLRRQLPMTKQKMDWDRVLNYNLGTELGEQEVQ